MIELIDNAIQLTVLIGCCTYSAVQAIRRNSHVWFLLTCFYGAYALGLVYWLLFIAFHSTYPSISPISDLSWMASVLFLIVMQNTLRLPGESTYRPLAAWAAPAFSTVMCFFLFQWGDYFLNILWVIHVDQRLQSWLCAEKNCQGCADSYSCITVNDTGDNTSFSSCCTGGCY